MTTDAEPQVRPSPPGPLRFLIVLRGGAGCGHEIDAHELPRLIVHPGFRPDREHVYRLAFARLGERRALYEHEAIFLKNA